MPAEAYATSANGLIYRDFMTVGLLLDELKIKDAPRRSANDGRVIGDNWIYIQEPRRKARTAPGLQQLVPLPRGKDPETTVCSGLEYFCNDRRRTLVR